MINNMSRTTVKANPISQNIVPENLGDEDSFLEEEDNNFAIRNQNYQLKSTIHKLEYEKNKLTISYENTIKELKHKYTVLEKIMTENNQKEDKGSNEMLQTLRAKCLYLTEENEQLKKQIHISVQQYRTTPNFKQLNNNSQGFTSLIAQLEKPQNLAYFEKMIDSGAQKKIDQLKGRVSFLQKQNYDLKQLNLRMEKEKEQTITAIGKQTEEHHNSILRFKDKTIEQLKRSNIEINLQLQQAKKTISQMSSNQSDVNAQQKHIKVLAGQLREKDIKISQLQQSMDKLQMEWNRAKLQHNKMENDLRMLESQRKESDSKRKVLQQQLFKLENQLNDARTAAYNQKLQAKKQVNSAKIDVEEEKMKSKYVLDEKTQQNKKLKETIIELNDTNEQFKQREINLTKNIDLILKENTILKDNIEKLMAQNQMLQKKIISAEKFRSLCMQKDATIDKLKQELFDAKQQAKKYSRRVQESQQKSKQNQERYNIEVELNHKQELIQLLMMDKEEISQTMRQLENKLKQKQQQLTEKTLKIANLQERLSYSEEDNKQLLLANDEQREKIEKLKKIKEDIENINAELKRQKNALAEKRREQSRIKAEQQRENSKVFDQTRGRGNKLYSEDQTRHISKEYAQEKQSLLQVIKQLKAQNYELQNRLSQAQNQRDRRGVDLDIKESELKNLKSDNFKPKQMIFQPLIDVAKKNQFNAVAFQSQVSQLQRQINNIRMMKQKQIQQFKKTIRKQMQEKYQNQLTRQKTYNNQLEKKCNYFTQKWNEEKKQNQEERQFLTQLEKENYSLKLELSQNLQELNKALQRCKYLEQKMKEQQRIEKKPVFAIDQFSRLKASYDQLAKNFQQQSLLLNNANQQIRRLNDILMIKESQLRLSVKSKVHEISPNTSFLKSNQNQQKQRSMNLLLDLQKSGDVEGIRTWVPRKSGPLYSRI